MPPFMQQHVVEPTRETTFWTWCWCKMKVWQRISVEEHALALVTLVGISHEVKVYVKRPNFFTADYNYEFNE
jgi:hypothetical protein